MRISSKRQIALPKNIMADLNLKPGDEVEIRVKSGTAYLVPVATIKVPRDQAWFWTKEWQEKEQEADLDLTDGKYRDFNRLEDLLKDLHGDH
jgi:AbrB family looped-hinge helix DNA binding protein